ncbi:RNA polymerase sigma factor [Chitinophaga pendula]|uniref:RNA polymerase sigma factor n=1 Tax=Chitinophaga TaxID=79328 RepID=UPI000BB05962|nr:MULTISPECIES: RNA polymerase sigma factor [Chitinophaga]ASZ14925.1 RNA polymerase subunit sigma-70 [Chitinophaga sp. MD30]UCJ05262.1 RNA polymerase sigma factor [Chitinophaga pendula]
MRDSEQEFLQLINEHKGILHKVSRMYMHAEADREDLYQEIILQLWQSYGSFNGQSRFSTWLYRVAVNTAITYFKKDRRRPDVSFGDSLPDVKAEGVEPIKEWQLVVFYHAVQLLNPIEKALIFYFMEGLSHKDIAANLGISEVNTRVKLNRTKEKLQQLIKKQGYEF